MDTTLPIDPLLKGASDIIALSPVIGTLLVAMAFTIVYLWRDGKATAKQGAADLDEERDRHAEEMAEIRRAHSVEMAEQRRLNEQLQTSRLDEVKTALQEVTKAIATVDKALLVLGGLR